MAGVTAPANEAERTGFDPSRDELLMHKVILAISSASVPHDSCIPGRLETRSLSYYLGVGIDHFGHDYARHEVLLQKAARQAIAMIRGNEATGRDASPVPPALADRSPEASAARDSDGSPKASDSETPR